MKLAITSQGTDLDSPVDARFGRTRYFLLIDSETGEFEARSNAQNVQAVQGAGIQAARSVIDAGVEAVITGHVGPKAFTTLQAANVKVHTGASGSAREAMEQFKAGQLASAGRADVQGHWG